MGRAMRWLKKVFTGKKEGDKDRNKEPVGTGVGASHGDVPPVERRRWSFAKPRNSVTDGSRGRRSSVTAVVAGELSQVRPCSCGHEREAKAAVMIQKTFRGYLARRALRALKSLVKIQALVRGYLVRKQAATTLRRLQTLMRLQASSNAMMKKASSRKSIEQEQKAVSLPVVHRRRVSEGGDTNFERKPRIVEMDTCQLRCRSSRIANRYAADPMGYAPPPLCSPLPYFCKPPPGLTHEYEPRQPKTTQNTPRLGALPAGCYSSPMAKGRTLYRDPSGSPRYMADTASSVARTRCQSAPRQRHAELRPSLGRDSSRKAPPTPPQQPQDSFSFKSSEISRMGDYSEISDEVTRDYYLDQLW